MYKFKNRPHAGEQLAVDLEPLGPLRPLVMGIPPGGLAIGRVIAESLDAPLDVALVHKLVCKEHPDVAVGAVDEDGEALIQQTAYNLGLSRKSLQTEAWYQHKALERLRHLFDQPPVSPKGRLVILCDDGASTGATLLAAIARLRRLAVTSVVVALPVAPPTTLERLEEMADRVLCLRAPHDFTRIEDYYVTFRSLTDGQMVQILREHRKRTGIRRAEVWRD